ncbi:hypothetical protein [Microbacterium sp. Bi98]|uniref:hypothetical protein n=1 Tax=Microbacterium sp. Bi98 TaxID=2821116 RepID=UPI001E29674C|nr:hypothetical protein [Microbacterium sp. Bi98]
MLDDGVTYAEIARTVGGTSTASVGRYAISRKGELAKLIDGEPTTANVIARLLEAADHARDARRHAKLTGSPVHQARMIKSESDVLSKLIDELGVTDMSIAEYLADIEIFTQAVHVMIRDDAHAARALLTAVEQFPELDQFARTLATHLEVLR